MKKHFWLFLLAIFFIGLASCSDDSPEKGKPFDPNVPVEAITFLPDSGGIRSKFVVKGSNFGTDISKIQVLFDGKRKATVISSTGDMIYCLVPKQDGGNNSVAVLIDGRDTAKVKDKTFLYTVAQSLSTPTGKPGVGGLIDGTLTDAQFNRIGGLGVVTGNNIIAFSTWDNNVRLISLDDNKVVTLSTSISGAKPAITKDRMSAYVITKGAPHKIYRFDQKSLWAPQRIATQIAGVTGDIWSAALDDEEKWLYFRDANGIFGRVELANTSNVQVLNNKCGNTGNNGISYMSYNSVDQHFYLSVQFYTGIYRISKDGQTVEQYAGFNGIGGGNGTRSEASFKSPTGIAIDSEGNLYVADSGGYTIRKISLAEGLVSTVAGQYTVAGSLTGLPLLSLLNYPYDIACDPSDNFYIGESWGTSIRKLAIE